MTAGRVPWDLAVPDWGQPPGRAGRAASALVPGVGSQSSWLANPGLPPNPVTHSGVGLIQAWFAKCFSVPPCLLQDCQTGEEAKQPQEKLFNSRCTGRAEANPLPAAKYRTHSSAVIGLRDSSRFRRQSESPAHVSREEWSLFLVTAS